jgi:hypothetical protein
LVGASQIQQMGAWRKDKNELGGHAKRHECKTATGMGLTHRFAPPTRSCGHRC